MSKEQEININLAKHPLVIKKREGTEDISVLIVRASIIQLDIQNRRKGSPKYKSCWWRRKGTVTQISPIE
jgi:hypothetical protein